MTVPEIDVTTLAELHARGATVIDVRNPDEYDAGHVPGAALIPLPEFAARIDEVPTDQPVYVICAVGGRSLKAAELLVAKGVEATNIAGGTKGWIAAGWPITVGAQP